MTSSGAQIHYSIRVAPLKGTEISQARYDDATRRALQGISDAFEAAGLPVAEIEAEGHVSYRATNLAAARTPGHLRLFVDWRPVPHRRSRSGPPVLWSGLLRSFTTGLRR